MRKSILMFVFAFLVLTVCSTAFAWSPRLEGRPDAFAPGLTRGYFIWHDDNGLHMWTTTKGRTHRFSGEIRTDGQFVDVHGKRLETDDWYRVGHEQHVLKFNFTTAGGEDGVNFKIEGGDHVNFDLFIDDHIINPEEIYVGYRGWHPGQSDFTLYR